VSRLPSSTLTGRRCSAGISKEENLRPPPMATSVHPTAAAARTAIRKGRDGSSQIHRAKPATMAASTARSNASSRIAPLLEVRLWSLAVSPSTPSRIELAWARRPPTSARDADRDQAAHRPTSRVPTESRAGGIRRGASAIVIREEMGRLT
jgi:hypothetical protein